MYLSYPWTLANHRKQKGFIKVLFTKFLTYIYI